MMSIKRVHSTMPRCKHKLYCVSVCLFVSNGGGSRPFANQTGEFLFVRFREEMKGERKTSVHTNTVVETKEDASFPLDGSVALLLR